MPTISFKVSAEEARALRRKVRAEKTTLSAYLRKTALGTSTEAPRKIVTRKHPVSGLPFNAAGTRYRVVSQEEIRAALADFP